METMKIDLTRKKKMKTMKTYLNVYSNGSSFGYATAHEAEVWSHLLAGFAAVVTIPLEITYEED